MRKNYRPFVFTHPTLKYKMINRISEGKSLTFSYKQTRKHVKILYLIQINLINYINPKV